MQGSTTAASLDNSPPAAAGATTENNNFTLSDAVHEALQEIDHHNNANDTNELEEESSSPPAHTRSNKCCSPSSSCHDIHPFHWFIRRTRTLWSELTLSEISGSMGDLGTFIPLVVALARERAIYLTPALFFAGLANVITGYSWDVPMPVQPMKSIAAVALSDSLNREQVTTAGLWMGIFMVILGVTQLMELVNVIIPFSVVSGLQIGVGLRLATKGITTVAALGWVDQADCILLAVLLSALCLYWLREPPEQQQEETSQEETAQEDEEEASNSSDEEQPRSRCSWKQWLACCMLRGGGGGRRQQYPVGLFLFLVGSIFAAVELATTDNSDGQYDLPLGFFGAPVAVWALDTVTGYDFKVGLLEGAIPQLPLTTLNSVISVCCLAHMLYPEKRKNTEQHVNDAVVSRRDVSISVGLMNLVLCPFGAMPNCHGAGGLAGQHRLGARHGASVVFLGTNKMLLAIFFGASVLTLLDALPDAVLGVMLAIAGQELATTGFILLTRESTTKRTLRINSVIAVITAMVIVALGKTHYGALSGWVAYMIYGDGTTLFVQWLRRKWNSWKEKRDRNDNCGGGEAKQETAALDSHETTVAGTEMSLMSQDSSAAPHQQAV